MKIGFIGCGNMASAIISGIRNKRNNEDEILAFDTYEPVLLNAKEKYCVTGCGSEEETVEKADILFLAVKPNVIADVLKKIDGSITVSSPLIISIVAGKSLDFLTSCVKNECKLVRVIPNINAKVGEAISAYCTNGNVTDKDKEYVETILNCAGKVMALDESYFPLFGVIGGCAPAFSYMFIDALACAGVKNGMKKQDALKIAAQTVYGSAKMIMESGENPWQLIDNVCSPGGTTIEGVMSLQADRFESAVHNAVDKALDKDSKL
ncbi:MAG: pyrroline-5-carboxylate reductase [Clostridiales bacterium]|nr:pyrroline-5-carboxylate reductase [Clostridiales bacterium]